MKDQLPSAEKILAEIAGLRQQQQTLILATHSLQNQPLASYAPFLEDEAGNFYLLLSNLAAHSVNLQQHQAGQSMLSVLLIEDEQAARNLFARKRLSYLCSVEQWSREHPHWQNRIDRLEEKFGKTIAVLASLSDFNLYCLIPKQGNYVRGFGQAYKLEDARHPIPFSLS